MRTTSGVVLIALGLSLFSCCSLPAGALSWFWASGRSLVLGGGSEGHVTRQAREREESERPTRVTGWATASALAFVGGVALIGAGWYRVRQGRLAEQKAKEKAAAEVSALQARISELESRAPWADES